jgi:cobalt-zinc-cadmium efflux system outer membrane protein
MRRPLAPALLALVLGTGVSFARAQEITFDDALALTEVAPDVRGAERALAARREGDARISEVITSPTEIQLMPGVRALSEQERGFEGQIGIAQGWSLSGLGGARRRAAEVERAALAAERRAMALSRRLEAARAWIELSILEQQVALAAMELRLAAALRERLERAAEAGVATSADASEARAFEGEIELSALVTEGQRLAAVLALGAAMGAPAAERARTAGPLPSPELPAHDALEARLMDVDALPIVDAARLAAIAERARGAEAAALGGATMQTGVQLYREAPDGLMIFGQLAFGVPLADLTARERARAGAEAERLEARHETLVLAAQRDAIAITHEVEHTRREERTLRGSIVPALELLVDRREAQLRAGETTTIALLDARRRLVAARSRLARSAGVRAWAEIRAWLMLAVVARSDGPESP